MDFNKSRELIVNALKDSAAVKQKLIDSHIAQITEIANAFSDCLASGGKLLFCGNGGSAADAQHLAAELLVRLRGNVNRNPLPALALVTDPSAITACGNDYSFEVYYERMVQALGKKGDLLVGITTSGKSKNVILALKAARKMGIKTVGFLGCEGGPAKAECDIALVVPSNVTARIQEAHIAVGHIALELTEEILFERGYIKRL